jgi:hypothetical protein
MKYLLVKIIVAGALAMMACCTPKSTKEHQVTFDTLKKYFQNPLVDYSTAPFWVWNDKVTKEKIKTELQDFKDQHIDQVIIHTRPGLITEYLSDEWNELCNYAVEKATSLNR